MYVCWVEIEFVFGVEVVYQVNQQIGVGYGGQVEIEGYGMYVMFCRNQCVVRQVSRWFLFQIFMFSFCVLVSLDFVLVLVMMNVVFLDMLLEIFVFSVFSCVLVLLWVICVNVFVSIMVCLFSGLVICFVWFGVRFRSFCWQVLVLSSMWL